LSPEACVSALLDQARRRGAMLQFDEPVGHWQADGQHIDVFTTLGRYRARRLIISAGAWVNSLLPRTPLPVRVERQTLHWFEPAGDADAFDPRHCPIHLWQFDGERFFYGFPQTDAGLKMAFHHDGEVTTADDVRREVAGHEVDAVRAAMRRFVPAADGRVRKSVVCLYTNTPNEHFWIDRHPEHANIVVASPCSGHGFKFAPVIGEILGDLVEQRSPRFALDLFRWR